MIAELAAANAAFDVIKQTIQNGKEIYDAGEALAQYFGLKNEIQKKAHEHGYKSDLEAFMAEEKLREMEDELKQMMIWQGRGGMWNDWLEFQSKMKQSRERAKKDEYRARMKRKKALVDTFMIGTAIATILACVGLVIFIFMQIAR
jgi:molecular chaperone GrpE (heat shock protein)